MKVNITGRRLELTEGLKSATERKLGKLSKFFNEGADAKVTFSIQKERHTAEVTIYAGGMIYRAEETNTDMYAAIDKVVDIIERQIRKNKTRLGKRLRESAFIRTVEVEPLSLEEKEFDIVRVKKHYVKPMSPEEAILQMNLLGHEFYLFKNSVSDEYNLVYRRKGGGYGLIEAE